MANAHSPARLSPLHALHVAAGAVFTEVASWQIVGSYGDAEGESRAAAASAGVCDISGRSAVRIKGTRLGDARAGNVPAVGSVQQDDDLLIARLTAEEALAIGPPSTTGSLLDPVSQAGDSTTYVIDLMSGLAGFRIVGPRARAVLAALTDLDLRDGSMPDQTCAQAGFAGVHGTLLRLDIAGEPAYELYVAREYGVYVWETVLEAGALPFGAEALSRLEQGR